MPCCAYLVFVSYLIKAFTGMCFKFSSFYRKGVGLEVMVIPEAKQSSLNCCMSQLNNLMKSAAFLTKKRERVLDLQVDVRN